MDGYFLDITAQILEENRSEFLYKLSIRKRLANFD